MISHDIASNTLKIHGGAGCAAVFQSNAEWVRLPQTGQRSPLCGLSRSSLNELVLPCAANGGRPPVKSVVLKKRHAMRGIRLIHVPSLLGYLDSLAADANAADPTHEEFVVEENGAGCARGAS